MVAGSKTVKIALDKSGSYLGMSKGCFVVRDRENNVKRYPLFEKKLVKLFLKAVILLVLAL
jgi:hypothetical protein